MSLPRITGITVYTGYDHLSIVLTSEKLRHVLKGLKLRRRGQKIDLEDSAEWTYWNFNLTHPGSLTIYTKDGGEYFEGSISDPDVTVTYRFHKLNIHKAGEQALEQLAEVDAIRKVELAKKSG